MLSTAVKLGVPYIRFTVDEIAVQRKSNPVRLSCTLNQKCAPRAINADERSLAVCSAFDRRQ
jgi:hypothetical protein